MPIDRISFSTSQESVNKIGLKSWKKFGAEYQVDEGENLEDAKKALKSFVYDSLKKQQEEVPEEITPLQKEEPQTAEQKIINQINSCNDITVLKSFELLSKNNENIKTAYQNKYNELSK